MIPNAIQLAGSTFYSNGSWMPLVGVTSAGVITPVTVNADGTLSVSPSGTQSVASAAAHALRANVKAPASQFTATAALESISILVLSGTCTVADGANTITLDASAAQVVFNIPGNGRALANAASIVITPSGTNNVLLSYREVV